MVTKPSRTGGEEEEGAIPLLSVGDLVELSREHLRFLRGLHSTGVTLRPVAAESLRRYRDLWLPLVRGGASSSSPSEPLIPPPDVAWLWHCHRLAPLHYVRYCQETFDGGDILDSSAPFRYQTEDGCVDDADSLATRKLWKQLHPNEPFFFLENSETEPSLSEENKKNDESSDSKEDSSLLSLLGGFDLAGSCRRQAGFLWQVSADHYTSDEEFLKRGAENYRRFLQLAPAAAASAEMLLLVPTLQIDLAWHTHMLASTAGYCGDCEKIAGFVLNHDDSLDDRAPGGVQDAAYRRTRRLWNELHGTEYAVRGGAYRGEPPASYYSPDWRKPGGGAAATAEEDPVSVCGAAGAGCGGGGCGGGCGNPLQGGAGCGGGGCGGGGCGGGGCGGGGNSGGAAQCDGGGAACGGGGNCRALAAAGGGAGCGSGCGGGGGGCGTR